MRGRTLLALGTAVLLLGAFIFFVERDLPSTDERREAAKKVLAFEPEEVEELRIEAGEESTLLRREPPEGEGSGTWRLAEPLEARADSAEVEALLDRLAELERERTVTDFEPAELGLEPPRATVRLRLGGEESVLRVGGEVPASSSIMVSVAGSGEAYRVPSSLLDELGRAPGDWRDPDLFPWTRAEVRSLGIEAAGTRLELGRRGDRFWIEGGPEGLPAAGDLADAERVAGILTALTSLRADSFVDGSPEPAELGLEPSRVVLEVGLEGSQEPFRIVLGGAAAESETDLAYALADGQIVRIGGGLGRALEAPTASGAAAAAWRSRAWSGLESFRIDSLALEDATGRLVLERSEGRWLRDGEEIPYAAASDLLAAVTEARGEQVLDLPAPAGPPLLRLELGTGGSFDAESGEQDENAEGPAETLALHRLADGRHLASSARREALLLFARERVESLEERIAAVRAAEPVAEEMAEKGNEASEDGQKPGSEGEDPDGEG